MNVKGFRVNGDELVLETTHDEAMEFALKNDPFKPGNFEITRRRKKRSLDANAYMWALCSEIADVVGCSKEEVYRRNIREVGEYTPLQIMEDAVEEFSQMWEAHGIGWFCDVVDNCTTPGYKLVFAYHGSSTYNSKQMSKLIDHIKEDAESVGIFSFPAPQIEAITGELGERVEQD